MYSKGNIERIEYCLICSYVFQTVLFGLLVYSFTKIKNDYTSTILILNNVILSLGDLAFRIIIEYRSQNAVVAE